MKANLHDLLNSVAAIKSLAAKVGLPDRVVPVKVADPSRFAANRDTAMRVFQTLRPGTLTLVSADENTYRKEIWIRVLQNGPSSDRNGQIELPLVQSFDSLRTLANRDGGDLHYWGGNNYFDVSLPYPGSNRSEFLEVKHFPWNEQYRLLLERESWSSLRNRVFRFSNLAAMLADRCLACRMTTVLIPSVGICIHPWLLASRGLTVTATDSAETALAALSDPGLNPNLYSSAAYERWDISTCALYAMMPHPEHFAGMPRLESDHVRETLRERISFVVADWAHLPVTSGTIDLVFATNAVPRESDAERLGVLEEWVRILRPGGIVYIAQHHAYPDWGMESFFLEHGFDEIDFLRGEDLAKKAKGGFQIRYSSG
jgi:hypothetical protein